MLACSSQNLWALGFYTDEQTDRQADGQGWQTNRQTDAKTNRQIIVNDVKLKEVVSMFNDTLLRCGSSILIFSLSLCKWISSNLYLLHSIRSITAWRHVHQPLPPATLMVQFLAKVMAMEPVRCHVPTLATIMVRLQVHRILQDCPSWIRCCRICRMRVITMASEKVRNKSEK